MRNLFEVFKINAKQAFPNFEGYLSYESIVKEIGHIIIENHVADYSGDSWYLLKSRGNGDYILVSFSWGSCSGCDMLLACSNHEDLQGVINIILSNSYIFDSLEDLKDYIYSRNESNSSFFYHEEGKSFLDDVRQYINEEREKC